MMFRSQQDVHVKHAHLSLFEAHFTFERREESLSLQGFAYGLLP